MRVHQATPAPGRVPALLALGLTAALSLTACGDDGDDGPDGPDAAGQESSSATMSPTPSPTVAPTTAAPKPSKTPKPLPACEEVWVEGAVLAKSYKGCVDEFDQVSKSVRSCSIGSKLGQYGDQYYAILGREIVRALPSRNENQDYLDLLETCSG